MNIEKAANLLKQTKKLLNLRQKINSVGFKNHSDAQEMLKFIQILTAMTVTACFIEVIVVIFICYRQFPPVFSPSGSFM